MYTKDKSTKIVTCECGHKISSKEKHLISTIVGEYFKDCDLCGLLNYRFFPTYIGVIQYKKFLKVLNEM